jgi:nitrogen fixation protein FixH
MEYQVKTKKPYGFWNWGTILTFVFILGASGIIFMVYRSQQMSAELVTENYYAEELQFQKKIDARTAANTLSRKVAIEYIDAQDAIVVSFPQECLKEHIKGHIYFYNPASGKQDRIIPIAMDAQGLQVIAADKIDKGTYSVQVEWSMNDKAFSTDVPFTKL